MTRQPLKLRPPAKKPCKQLRAYEATNTGSTDVKSTNTADIRTLGRRVRACLKVWRWRKGMPLTCRGYRGHVVEVGEGAIVFAVVMQAMNGSKEPLMIAVEILGIDPPDMNDPGIQGHALALIAEHNHRRSTWDALHDAYNKVGRGLSYPEALTELIEECEAQLTEDNAT